MRHSPLVITAASVLGVSLAEAKEHLRITHSDHDDLITRLIHDAEGVLARRTGRSLHQQTLEMYWDAFPVSYLELPRATPLISVTHVKYKDEDGTEYTWSSALYIADTKSMPGRIYPASGESWPSTTLYPASGVWARYVAGQETTSPLTELEYPLKKALLRLVGHWYSNPEDTYTEDNNDLIFYGLEDLFEELLVGRRF